MVTQVYRVASIISPTSSYQKDLAIHKLHKEMPPKGIYQETSSGVVPRKEIFSRNTSKKLLIADNAFNIQHVKRVIIKFITMFSAQHLILS